MGILQLKTKHLPVNATPYDLPDLVRIDVSHLMALLGSRSLDACTQTKYLLPDYSERLEQCKQCKQKNSCVYRSALISEPTDSDSTRAFFAAAQGAKNKHCPMVHIRNCNLPTIKTEYASRATLLVYLLLSALPVTSNRQNGSYSIDGVYREDLAATLNLDVRTVEASLQYLAKKGYLQLDTVYYRNRVYNLELLRYQDRYQKGGLGYMTLASEQLYGLLHIPQVAVLRDKLDALVKTSNKNDVPIEAKLLPTTRRRSIKGYLSHIADICLTRQDRHATYIALKNPTRIDRITAVSHSKLTQALKDCGIPVPNTDDVFANLQYYGLKTVLKAIDYISRCYQDREEYPTLFERYHVANLGGLIHHLCRNIMLHRFATAF